MNPPITLEDHIRTRHLVSLVYELYGLTEEEIGIVEGTLANR
jgi:hypothetical protein